jgi:hypothetical protein
MDRSWGQSTRVQPLDRTEKEGWTISILTKMRSWADAKEKAGVRDVAGMTDVRIGDDRLTGCRMVSGLAWVNP